MTVNPNPVSSVLPPRLDALARDTERSADYADALAGIAWGACAASILAGSALVIVARVLGIA